MTGTILTSLAGVIGLLWVALTMTMASRRTEQAKAKAAEETAESAKRAIEQKMAEAIAVKTAKINQANLHKAAQAKIDQGERGDFDKDTF